MTATARKMTQCHCQTFEFGTYDPDTQVDETFTTNCNQSTWKTFAMGHDAKLAGYLVRAELDGEEISQTVGGMRITYPGAVAAAQTVSEAFAAKVAAQLVIGVARAIKKAAAAARKASKGDAPAPTPVAPTTREATIKVGRWTYPATIDLATGQATYANKAGAEFTTDKFTEVA